MRVCVLAMYGVYTMSVFPWHISVLPTTLPWAYNNVIPNRSIHAEVIIVHAQALAISTLLSFSVFSVHVLLVPHTGRYSTLSFDFSIMTDIRSLVAIGLCRNLLPCIAQV